MSLTEWIIQLSILGVMAMAVIGTIQKLVDAMKKTGSDRRPRPVIP